MSDFSHKQAALLMRINRNRQEMGTKQQPGKIPARGVITTDYLYKKIRIFQE
jgi:hypothetical protein